MIGHPAPVFLRILALPPFFTRRSYIISAHVKIANTGRSRSGHRVTSWPYFRKVRPCSYGRCSYVHHSYTGWSIALKLSAIDMSTVSMKWIFRGWLILRSFHLSQGEEIEKRLLWTSTILNTHASGYRLAYHVVLMSDSARLI